MPALVWILTFVLVLMTTGESRALDLPVSYLVDQKALRAGAVAGTLLTVELHTEASCSTPVHTDVVAVDDIVLIESLKSLAVRNAPKPARLARIHHVVAGAPAVTGLYVKLTGAGIQPVPGACQPQTPVVAGPQGAPGAPGVDGTTIPCVSVVGTDVIFEGCNVHVRDGSGTTDGATNGLGNRIVGYNEDDLGPVNARNGSHNLVVGPEHTYSSFGGFVAGRQNSIIAMGASVSGGLDNRVTQRYAAVCGGELNEANGPHATVSGGYGNEASGDISSVSGGSDNLASGFRASVSGGSGVTQSAPYGWAAGPFSDP
jgi:hypothetical protein